MFSFLSFRGACTGEIIPFLCKVQDENEEEEAEEEVVRYRLLIFQSHHHVWRKPRGTVGVAATEGEAVVLFMQ